MATVSSDNFDRPDSATMGGNWVDRAGDMQIKSNQAFASGTSYATDGETVGSADYKISLDHTYDGTQANWLMITGRASTEATPNNCYWLYIQNETGGQDFAQILKRVSSSQSQIGSTYNYTATATETRTWMLSMEGTAIKAYEDGVERISATDSSLTTESSHGMRMGNGFYCDNYLLEDFSAGGSTFVPRVMFY